MRRMLERTGADGPTLEWAKRRVTWVLGNGETWPMATVADITPSLGAYRADATEASSALAIVTT